MRDGRLTITGKALLGSALGQSIVSLGVLQGAYNLISLLIVPFLTRMLGVNGFGKLALAQAVIGTFTLLTNFGFNLSATRKVAARREDHIYLSKVFINVWSAQWALLLVCCVAALVCYYLHLFPFSAAVYTAAMAGVIGNLLLPVWFLEGLERFRDIAILQICARLVSALLIVALVRATTGIATVLLIQGGAAMLAGLLGLYWMRRLKLIVFARPSFVAMTQELREGFGLFISTSFIHLYTTLVPLILGWAAGAESVGYFAVATRAQRAAQSLLTPVSQALFPRMSHLFVRDPVAARRLLVRAGIFFLLAGGTLGSILWFGATGVIYLMGGKDFWPAIRVLQWLAFVPLIIACSNILGIQIMLPLQLNTAFNRIVGCAAVVGLISISLLARLNGAVGAAQAVLLVEGLVTLMMLGYLLRRKTRPRPAMEQE